MTEPKFKPGDAVQHKHDPHGKMMVISRLSEECPGGLQQAYDCRMIVQVHALIPVTGISTNLIRFWEIELEPWVPQEKPKVGTGPAKDE